MKRLINAKTYDTATASKIGRSANEDRDEKTSREHILYKTRGGVFFLHMHEEWRAKDKDGEWTPNHHDHFTLMTRKEAEKWMMTGEVEPLSDEFQFPEATAEEEPSEEKDQKTEGNLNRGGGIRAQTRYPMGQGARLERRAKNVESRL